MGLTTCPVASQGGYPKELYIKNRSEWMERHGLWRGKAVHPNELYIKNRPEWMERRVMWRVKAVHLSVYGYVIHQALIKWPFQDVETSLKLTSSLTPSVAPFSNLHTTH